MTPPSVRRPRAPIFGCEGRSLTLSILLGATVALNGLPALAGDPPKDCGLKQYAALQVTYYEGFAAIPLLIDEHSVRMTLDTNSAVSVIAQWAVQQLGLRVQRPGLVNITVGKEHLDTIATIRSLTLGNARLKDTAILIFPTHPGSHGEERSIDRLPVGRLGMDLLGGVDVELDLGHDRVNLFSTEHCPGPGGVVYWADQAAVIPMRRGELRDLYFVMELDGKKLQTKLSTGDPSAELSSRVTRSLYGWDEDSPELQTLQTEDGRSRRYRIMTLTAGGLQVRNSQVMLFTDTSDCMKRASVMRDADGAMGFEGCRNVYPLHLGMDVLKKLRLYLATKEQKMHLTSADAHKSSDQ